MNLDVTPEEAQLILTGLAELPAKMSFNLLAKLVPMIQLKTKDKPLVKVPPVEPTQPDQQQD